MTSLKCRGLTSGRCLSLFLKRLIECWIWDLSLRFVKIVNEIPPRRQTLMYSGTWPKEVRKIANDLLINLVQVNIGSVDELAANKSITQFTQDEYSKEEIDEVRLEWATCIQRHV